MGSNGDEWTVDVGSPAANLMSEEVISVSLKDGPALPLSKHVYDLAPLSSLVQAPSMLTRPAGRQAGGPGGV